MNQLVITYDSCRYDAFVSAKNRPKELAEVHLAYSHCTMTGPSHWALFMGYLPHVFQQLPFYNRFVRPLWTLQGDRSSMPLFDLETDRSILDGLGRMGYSTVGLGSRAWFDNARLREDFDVFVNSGTDAARQTELALQAIRGKEKFFLFVNFGETHIPYQYAGAPWEVDDPRPTQPVDGEFMESSRSYVFPEGIEQHRGRELWYRQVKCCEFINGYLAAMLKEIPTPYLLVVTADHGDCFGEPNPHGEIPKEVWGHGVFHPRILEVPLSIQFIGTDSGASD